LIGGQEMKNWIKKIKGETKGKMVKTEDPKPIESVLSIGDEWEYEQDIFCPKCNTKTRLLPGFQEWNLEIWECINKPCKTILEVRVIYENKHLEGRGNQLTPVRCKLEKVW